MTNKTILIDAAHREETRVVVLEDGILQDFDREAISIKQIKGNIYLAKVTRVEPSLQAAFVEYGSDRHGFLPFGDIHPDYYNLPEAEKQKLRELFSKENAPAEEVEEVDPAANAEALETPRDAQIEVRNDNVDRNNRRGGGRYNDRRRNSGGRDRDNRDRNEDSVSEPESAITTGSYSVEDETERSSGNIHSIHKRYSIQDVIKPGQTFLVQATKEERGNKGASMTTYISLAGKYCVSMSNTPNKGGVSRKVDNFRDRKLLKAILTELSIPNDRSVIIRTAGVGKKPEEIKRDYEYLNRLWESIQEAAKTSKAPSFIHAEDDVIKRCIRDVYNDTVSEVIIEGKEAFETVSNFIKMTMSGGNHNIKFHDDKTPIFNKYRVEPQISALYEKNITLKSGGSIVIDHTEALVSIDVNSGKATKEGSVEETAYQTNLEAAKEIAKQLRLRDLAGLIVIDFIDMYDQRHRRQVERTLRDELQNDRARIQIGRISVFGLLELSRQRLGASLFETITQPCKSCNGTGHVRSVEILAMAILRAIRYTCTDKQVGVIYLYTSNEVIAYMANYKKHELIGAEDTYRIHIFMHPKDDVGGVGFLIKKRKGLSEEEKREIEMEVVTGKVNLLDLERKYLDSELVSEDQTYDETATSLDDKKNYQNDRRDNRDNRKNDYRSGGNNRFNNRNRRGGGRRYDNRNQPERGGIIKSIFGKIFK